jgi:hypothetical protein
MEGVETNTMNSLRKRATRRRVALVAVALVAALSVVGVAISSSTQSDEPVPDPQAVVQLRDAIAPIAAANGEKAATNGRVVLTTRDAAAAAVSGGQVFSEDPVYAVVVEGSFTSSHHPSGTEAPSGKYLTVTFDVTTLETRDLMLTQSEPKIDQLGTVVPLGN